MAKEHLNDVSAQVSMSASCISLEPTMLQGKVCRSNPPVFDLGLNLKKEEKVLQANDDEEEEAVWPCLMKNSIMFIFMLSASAAILVYGAPPLLPSFLHNNVLRKSWQSAEFSASVTQGLRRFEGVWGEYGIPPRFSSIDLQALQQYDLLLLGSVIAPVLAAIMAAKVFASKPRKSPKDDYVVEAAIEEVEAETEHLATDKRISSLKPPCSERQYSPLVEKSALEENSMQWDATSKPEVKFMFEYSPAEMSTSEKKVVTREDLIQRRDKKPRRRSMSSVTREMSVDSSPYQGFMSSEKLVAGQAAGVEEVRVAPLRRSTRIRNQALSPPSASRLLISSKG
eukprot:Gb_04068 [translate_table: standard]